MGFRDQLNSILEYLPPSRQTMLFSATQTKSIKDLARLSLKKVRSREPKQAFCWVSFAPITRTQGAATPVLPSGGTEYWRITLGCNSTSRVVNMAAGSGHELALVSCTPFSCSSMESKTKRGEA